MPLSRLENFLKNVDGNVIYVNPTDLDATDSIENQGNSLTRPFKTIQRSSIRRPLDFHIKLDKIMISLIVQQSCCILACMRLTTNWI